MPFVADLHVHSKYSRATSRDLDLEHLARWAQLKGITVVGTGDFTHPAWFAELKEKLVPAEDGLFRLRDDLAAAVEREVPAACRRPVRFMLQVEISNIYKKDGRVRKVHNLCYVPDFDAAERFRQALARIGNIESDGRPILGLDSRDLLEITLDCDPRAFLIPAHIWTPWFSALGAQSGFDSIEECFGDLADHIFAVETGLSSDPPMNWRLSALDRYALVSNSDAHSPAKLGREAVVFDGELSYDGISGALRSRDPARFLGTIEFFPEEGKYHFDGHRACGVRLSPGEAREREGRCPACGKTVTRGVLSRVEELADRPDGARPAVAAPYRSLVPMDEVLGAVLGVSAKSRAVEREYTRLLGRFGPELDLLCDAPLEDLDRAGGPVLAEAVRRVRTGELHIAAGYDGEYGVIQIFDDDERRALAAQTTTLIPLTPPPGAGEKAPGMVRERRPDVAPAEPAEAAEQPGTRRRTRTRKGADAAHAPARSSPEVPPPGRGGDAGRSPGRQGGGEGPPPPSPAVDLAELPLFAGLATPEADLDEDQRAAVEAGSEPLLILAGPGTGKTRVLTYRIAHLIERHGVPPTDILAVTFTRRAAGELRERLERLVGPERAAAVAVRTFHAFGLDVLAGAPDLIGRGSELRVLDEDAALEVLAAATGARATEARRLAEAIARAKERLLGPDDVRDAELADAFRRYEAALVEAGAVDFDDLSRLAVQILRDHPAVRETWQNRCRWILVDEFQDASGAQFELLRLLAPTGERVTAVGDPDQAIYGFRGADSTCVRRFAEEFAGARSVRLRRCYRCTDPVLRAARRVVAPDAPEDLLRAVKPGGAPAILYETATEEAEAETVAREVERLVGGTSLLATHDGASEGDGAAAGDVGFADIAVLYRTHAQAAALEEALGRAGIPVQRVSTPPDESHPYDARAQRVALMSLHASKGLEFPVVFVTGCEEGLLPYRRPGAAPEEVDVDEERRLLYVGMTRASRLLFLTRARRRMLYGETRRPAASPFLDVVPAELLRRVRGVSEPKRDVQLALFRT